MNPNTAFKLQRFIFCAIAGLAAACAQAQRLPLDKIRLPPGFQIAVFASNIPNARGLAWGDKGTLFVGSRGAGCEHMVKIREDLVDPRRPSEVQLLTVWMSESPCGEQWVGKPPLQSNRCDVAVPLLREIDWAAMRAAMGW